MSTRRGFIIGAGAVLAATALGAVPGDLMQIEGPAFGARWRVLVPYGADTGAIVAAVRGVVARTDARMSPYLAGSEISRVNGMQTRGWITVSHDTRATLGEAKRIHSLTQGAFDPTLGGITGRYGFGPIEEAPAGVFERLEIGPRGIRKAHVSQTLDLCGIAKGHALDLIVGAISALGHEAFFVELGGEVFAKGQHPAGRDWQAGIETPLVGAVGHRRIVRVAQEALATSGDRVNSYGFGSRSYGHIIDPRRQMPADTGLASVSVFAPRAITADALATALFVMGAERGVEWAKRAGVAALFLRREGDGLREVVSSDFASRFVG